MHPSWPPSLAQPSWGNPSEPKNPLISDERGGSVKQIPPFSTTFLTVYFLTSPPSIHALPLHHPGLCLHARPVLVWNEGGSRTVKREGRGHKLHVLGGGAK
nr:hypothetical protein [Morchella crassipes]